MSEKVKVCGLEWKDTTSYSRGQDRNPTCWTAEVGVFSVTVLSSHLYHFGEWVGHCEPFFDTKPLNAKTRDEAMVNALLLAMKPIAEAYAILKKIKVRQ